MTKIIAIINHKGGVGKTTTTINLGSALALKGFKTLLMDLDPQTNLTQSFGKESSDRRNMYNAFVDIVNDNKIDLPIEQIKNNLDIVPSSLDLSASELELVNEPGKEFLVRELLKPIESNYDYIIMDCPPTLGLLTINALTAANHVIVPIQAEFLAMKGMFKLIYSIDKIKNRLNKDLSFSGVLITQFDSRVNLHKTAEEQVAANFDKLFKTRIRKNIALAEAQSNQIDIFDHAPKSPGAEDYMNLAEEIIIKIQ
ncbi:chromosome partitioning protein [Dysgonomonas sp. PFB1-18]|uniref:ParA family protein n=1 Tax=unclassified Dysgonomonas TaxID=2630389 RepID=UPI0024758DF0|nr:MULTISPECIES: ParA family protein [unclassified Dysgonomonas]MDH6311208.1 chromosome partitioning protein [Dysgonomonas sp. PF1-14]MDH6341100.1 chromosome partitioning protein [Dysgonomonas sp. PF1-16]MDH6382536.1 chromosome partitioning protein [Dysgonomonas sp. PFB1-18]MDH6399930.1 chromosome partitioning protein [Dysgonomonas sp. PF1-23]